MRVLRQVTLLLVAGIILTAPMACVRFCELQRDLARPRLSLAEMARLHALTVAEREAQDSPHSDDHAPLARLKRMVSSVTEFVLIPGVAVGAGIVVMRTIIPVQRLDQPALVVPKPPPRLPVRLLFLLA